MRHLLSKVTTELMSKVLATVSALILVVVIVPAVAMAWGPDRPTYTQAVPADHVTFDSITDNPTWGDERNFMRIRDLGTNASFGDTASLQAGHQYEIIILYHNNASSSLNAGGTGIAHGAYARTEIPAIVRSGQSGVEAMAYVGASNAQPSSVYDDINFTNPTSNDIALRYVKGTAKLTNNGGANGASVPDALFSSTGTPLGFDSLDGTLPGCDHYSGYITFTVTADTPGFTFAKSVRLAGTKNWSQDITVNPGAKVEYQLGYQNTGTIDQADVVMKDALPKGLNYVEGQTDLVNSNTPSGERLGDTIDGDGVNIGDYGPGANAYLYLFATVNAPACSVLTNTAGLETTNGNREATATVRVAGTCAASLPTTGPAEVIASFLGLGAMTVGIVYYFKSRRDLGLTTFHAQISATTLKSAHPDNDHDHDA